MRVRCVSNDGKRLLELKHRPVGVTSETRYNHLDVGVEYEINAMFVADGVLYYILDSSGYVYACPAPLFTVVSNSIPRTWSFCLVDTHDSRYPYPEALWGYPELTDNPEHYNALLDQHPDARHIYFRRKVEMERSGPELD